MLIIEDYTKVTVAALTQNFQNFKKKKKKKMYILPGTFCVYSVLGGWH
jgi:hypothetical protein